MVDPYAESLYSMSPYQAMGNNPILYSDPDGDFIPQLVGGIVGGGLNVINNWDKILTNPVSAFGYAATGIGAGVVATLPGGIAASRAILAGGNVATDIASGNIPSFDNFGDVASYAGGTAIDAFSTAGASKAIGQIAKSSLKNAALKAGKEIAEEGAFSLISDAELAEMTLQWYGQEVGTGVTVQITDQAINWGARAAGNLGVNAASTGLGIHGNSVNSPKPSGYYEVTYQDGRTYHGVGPEGRMNTSANRYATPDNPVVNKSYTPTANRADAYMLEQRGINRTGGVKSSRNFNKRNSPGKKLLKALKKVF